MVIELSANLHEEVTALIESGHYESEEAFINDAVRTFLAARPDLREEIASTLYKRGYFSLGRAAEWSGLSLEVMKRALDKRGIPRHAPESPAETEAMAKATIEAIDKSQN